MEKMSSMNPETNINAPKKILRETKLATGVCNVQKPTSKNKIPNKRPNHQ
jgi:hypothetical protein